MLPRHHVAGGIAAADHRGPGAQHPRVRPLGPAQAKLHHPVPLGGPGHPVALGGDQRLVADQVEHGALNQLGLGQGRPHPHHGLPGEDDGALRHDVYIPLKAEVRQAF